MKALLFVTLGAFTVGGIGWYLARPRPAVSDASIQPIQRTEPPPSHVSTDGTQVFQKAFWKHPTAEDKILHAERREWTDGDGVSKWQWFLVVRPSAELLTRLRTDNAFNLTAQENSFLQENVPDWFRHDPAQYEVMKAPAGSMTLAFGKSDNLIYATDSGAGFRPGTRTAPPAAVANTAAKPGRLPNSPPPKP